MKQPKRYQTFFAELKRRHVFPVAAVYGTIAFAVMQAADFLVPALRSPRAVEWKEGAVESERAGEV